MDAGQGACARESRALVQGEKRIHLALKSERSLRFMSVAHDKMKVRSKLLWKSVKWERDEALCVTLKWSAGYGH